MLDEIARVSALWETDKALAAVIGRLRALEDGVSSAEARVSQLAQDRAREAAEAAAAAEEERTLQRRLDDYSTRKTRTQGLIDSGRATDFITASRQVEQCQTIIEELETSIFALMEAAEARAERLDALSRSEVLAAARLREALADREAESPGLNERRAALEALRAQQNDVLPRADQTRYFDLRRRGLEPFAVAERETCTGCHQRMAPMVAIEVAHERRVHHCRGCQRWLVAPPAAEP